MDKLQEFHNDKDMVATVHASMIATLKDIAGADSLAGHDMSHAQLSKEAIDTFFVRLKARYSTEKEKKVENPE